MARYELSQDDFEALKTALVAVRVYTPVFTYNPVLSGRLRDLESRLAHADTGFLETSLDD